MDLSRGLGDVYKRQAQVCARTRSTGEEGSVVVMPASSVGFRGS
jgi:hypothetical protein